MPTATAEPVIEFTSPMPPTSSVPAVHVEQTAPAVQPLEPATILQVIARVASDPAADIEKMERLIAMQERMEGRQQQIEFDRAMADAQASMKAIRADLQNPQTKSNYASYAALDKAIRPIYARHGFAVSFNTGDTPKADELRVLATVSHRAGHRQEYRIDMPADGKGARGNDVMTRTHATGAAASYGQRYLYKLIFNLAVGDVDDDGNGAGSMGEDDDVESLAPANAPRDANGKLLSTYNVERANKARDWADGAIQRLNLIGTAEEAREWRSESETVPQGKRKSPLHWLRDNSRGQYLRVRQTYQNVTGEDLE